MFEDLQDTVIFGRRRKKLCEKIKADYPEKAEGLVILVAGFETEKHLFRQESS